MQNLKIKIFFTRLKKTRCKFISNEKKNQEQITLRQ